MNTNLLHLFYFYQVAKAGSITSASLLLNIQQPALSIMLKKFEVNTGFPVFEKKGRKIQLTEKGRELFVYAEEVFAKVQKLEEFVGQKSDEISGKLKIATNDLIAHYVLTPILAHWMKRYPAASLSIQYMSAQEACEKLIRDEIDYGLFFYGPEEMAGIEIEKLKKIPFICAGDKKNVESFIGSREVDYSLTRKLPTYEKLKKIFPEIRVQLNTNGLMLHKELALKGGGAVVLPTFAIKEEIKKKQLHNLLPNEKLEFSLKLYQRKNKILSATQDLFLDDVIKELKKI